MTTRPTPIRAGASLTEAVLEVMRANPRRPMTPAEVAPLAGVTKKQAGNVLTRSRLLGRVGVTPEGYIYPPELGETGQTGPTPRGHRPKKDQETPADLRPITDDIDDDMFKRVGLRPVGRAADGSRVCVDDQGQAWRVKVTVEARLV